MAARAAGPTERVQPGEPTEPAQSARADWRPSLAPRAGAQGLTAAHARLAGGLERLGFGRREARDRVAAALERLRERGAALAEGDVLREALRLRPAEAAGGVL
ncbi:MAG: hypothetical protein HY721_25060 [Planctomycetes bacterium]|nr:hypothetical protein [Planctomycetota bacterium]